MGEYTGNRMSGEVEREACELLNERLGGEWVGCVCEKMKDHLACVLTLADAATGDSCLLELHGGS